MGKKVSVTSKIIDMLRLVLGDPEADPNKFSIFETRMLSTEPLSKGGFWNKARVTASTLKEMQTKLQAEGGAVPLQIMHNTGVLPVGKVFHGEVMPMDNGETELRGLMLVANDEQKIISDIENSIVDEVSVGILTTHAFCSECEFDYFGKDASLENFFSLTCDNGHVIGQEGVHVRLSGLEQFSELSLVGKGAAKNAKILPRSKQTLSKETQDRLAAVGGPLPADARFLNASFKMSELLQPKKGDEQMDKELIEKLSTLSSDLATAKLSLTASEARVADLVAQLAAATKKVADLEAAQGQTAADLTLKADKAEQNLAAAAEKLLPHAKAALVASGTAEADLPKDVMAMLTMIEAKGLKLHQVFGAEPNATAVKVDLKTELSVEDRRKEAFKTNK